MAEKNITCIICPIGCEITVQGEGDRIDSITGNTCKRGETYIRNEVTDPRRTLTSTVKLVGAAYDKFLPVKTDGAIPKGRLFEAMEVLSKITVKVPVKRGDVLVEDFLGEGIALVAGKTVDA